MKLFWISKYRRKKLITWLNAQGFNYYKSYRDEKLSEWQGWAFLAFNVIIIIICIIKE